MGIFDFDKRELSYRKALGTSLLLQIFVKTKSFITLPIITLFIVPKDMGIFAYVSVTAALLSPYLVLNLVDGPAIILVQEEDVDRRKRYYVTLLNVVVLLLAINLTFFYLVSRHFRLPFSTYYFSISFLILTDIFFKITSYLFSLFQNFPRYVKYMISNDLLTTAITLVLAVLGFGYKSFVIAIIAGNACMGSLAFFYITREIGLRPRIDTSFLKTALRLSILMLPIYSFTFVLDSADNYFLMFYFGPEQVGIYKVAYSLSSIVLSVSALINLFWTPVSSRLLLEDRTTFFLTFRVVSSYTLLAIFVLTLLFEINASGLFNVFVRNTEYHEARHILSLICLAMALKVYLVLITGPLYAERLGSVLAGSYLIAAALNIVLNFLLIPSFGIQGAAASTVISYLLVSGLMIIACRRRMALHVLETRVYFLLPCFLTAWILFRYFFRDVHLLHSTCISLLFLFLTYFLTISLFSRADERPYIVKFRKALLSDAKRFLSEAGHRLRFKS